MKNKVTSLAFGANTKFDLVSSFQNKFGHATCQTVVFISIYIQYVYKKLHIHIFICIYMAMGWAPISCIWCGQDCDLCCLMKWQSVAKRQTERQLVPCCLLGLLFTCTERRKWAKECTLWRVAPHSTKNVIAMITTFMMAQTTLKTLFHFIKWKCCLQRACPSSFVNIM